MASRPKSAARRLGALLAALGLLAGCLKVGPDYRPPEPVLPAAYGERPGVTVAPGLELAAWWRRLGDPVLDDLVARALAGSPDLELALARIAEARAVLAEARGGELPSLGTGVSFQRRQDSLHGPEATRMTSAAGGRVAFPRRLDAYQAGFDASWELDLFGQVARRVEGAEASAAAAREDWGAARVSLLAEVAREYLRLRETQARQALEKERLAASRELARLNAALEAAGLAPAPQVDRAREEMERVGAGLPPLAGQEEASIHRLGVLCGLAPRELGPLLSPAAAPPELPPTLQVSLPAELLRRRPDLGAAERRLAAATAAIGVAEAQLYPRLTLTGALGWSATSFGDLTRQDSIFYFLGPGLTWPLFEGGRLRARVQGAEARADQALAEYRRTVLAALEEVENALARHAQYQEQRRATEARLAAARGVWAAQEALHRAGIGDRLAALEAQRTMLTAQADLLGARVGGTTSVITLYKALGGGWPAPETGKED